MRTLILNSGRGSRMGDLTQDHPKCLTWLTPQETILDRQLRLLMKKGIDDIVITTGYLSEMIKEHISERNYGLHISFADNPLWEKTNYIYSIYCAREHLKDHEIMLLHGDLVFSDETLSGLMATDRSAVVVSSTKELPQKDFKALLSTDGRISEIGVNTWGNSAVALQPMYHLTAHDWNRWLEEICQFCEDGIPDHLKVYAEEAYNRASDEIGIVPYDVEEGLCAEIDTLEDLHLVRKQMTMSDLHSFLSESRTGSLLVAGQSIKKTMWWQYLQHEMEEGYDISVFSDFVPNPSEDSAVCGSAFLKESGADRIIAIGGGSAMDVAKGIRKYDGRHLPMLFLPMTAGSGSEATSFAVLYRDGEKISVSGEECLPDVVLFDPDVLRTLPKDQKISTMLDVMCHSIESLWSVNSTVESRRYALEALRTVWKNRNDYLMENESCYEYIQYAAYRAGQAINISKTTAGHAMCYKLTTMYGVPHGASAALCVSVLWADLLRRISENSEKINEDLRSAMSMITGAMDYDSTEKAEQEFSSFVFSNVDGIPGNITEEDIEELAAKVNTERMNNYPMRLSEEDIRRLYSEISLSWRHDG